MIRFGPSGNSAEFNNNKKFTVANAPEWLAQRGLTAYELPFGMGITMSMERAAGYKQFFADKGIEVSGHCPYYVNLASQEDEKVEAIPRYIIGTMQRVEAIGGRRSVFHPGSVKKLGREASLILAKERLARIIELVYENNFGHHMLAVETMGKHAQMGNLEEVIALCQLDKVIYPCIDFGHLNARDNGYIKSITEYRDIIKKLTDNIEFDKVKNMHIHFSKIEYTEKGGEVRHLTFEDNKYGPQFEPLMEVIAENELQPYVICESAGTQDIDAMRMMAYFNEL